MTMTLEQIRAAMAVKIKLTKHGYEATVKGDTPAEVVALARTTDAKITAMRERGETPVEPSPNERKPIILEAGSDGAKVQAGGGQAAPFNAAVHSAAEDYRVRVDLVANTKGLGWEITAKAATVDEALGLIAQTKALLQETFTPAEDAVKGA